MRKRTERKEFSKVLSFGRGGVDSLPVVWRLTTGVGEGLKLAPPAIRLELLATCARKGHSLNVITKSYANKE